MSAPARAIPRRVELFVVLAALALLCALAWWGLLAMPMPMPGDAPLWSSGYVVLTISMWIVMMVAMMTPSVAPVVWLFDRSQGRGAGHAHGRTLAFLAGYFCAWLAFSIVVSIAQVALIDLGWVDTMMRSQRQRFSGALLLAIGAYQFLPFKHACLAHCRDPVGFLTRHFRPGLSGAWRTGVVHGFWCVGCCGVAMLALFVGGVMNLAWIVALAALVALEKWLPSGEIWSRVLGAGALVAGTVLTLAQ